MDNEKSVRGFSKRTRCLVGFIRKSLLPISVIGVTLLMLSPLLNNFTFRQGVILFYPEAEAAEKWRFHLEEATIADVHRAFRSKQLTATQLVNVYLKRIEAYNGTCVKGTLDPTTGLQLGDTTPIPNAGQLNALLTLNIRGRRSKTDLASGQQKNGYYVRGIAVLVGVLARRRPDSNNPAQSPK